MPTPKGMPLREFYAKQHDQYRAALIAQAKLVVSCGELYVDFVNIRCRDEYIREEYYIAYIDDNRDGLPILAKAIDNDLKIYWRGSLCGLQLIHKSLCAEYDSTTKKIGGKALVELFGGPNKAKLQVIAIDVGKALQRLPTKEFTDVSHVQRWISATSLCCNVITRAQSVHLDMVKKISAFDQKRSERIRARNAALLGATSAAATVAKLFVGLPPAP